MKCISLTIFALTLGTSGSLAAIPNEDVAGISPLLRAVDDIVWRTDAGPVQVLAVSGDMAVVGAADGAHIFNLSGSTWTFDYVIVPDDLEPGNGFPTAIAIDGDRMALGSGQDDELASNAGAVYLYENSPSGWEFVVKLFASDPDPDDSFGTALALDSNRLVVGAWSDDEVGTNEGAAYAFHDDGTGWALQGKILGPLGLRSRFGYSVAMDGDFCVIGAPNFSHEPDPPEFASTDGWVSFFEWDGSQWNFSHVRTGIGQGRFGYALDLDADVVAISEIGWGDVGYVHMFEYDGDLYWPERPGVFASDAWDEMRFGISVGFSTGRLAVTALNPGESTGYLYVCDREGEGWREQFKLGEEGLKLGSCALGGPHLLGASSSLHAWLLDAPIGSGYCSRAVPNSSGNPGAMAVFGSTAVGDDDVFLAALNLPTESNIGYFLMGTGTNTFVPPGSVGRLCITPGLKRYLPPVSNTNELPGGFLRQVGTSGPVSELITPGSTWNFQAWHRDVAAGTSNLTDAMAVVFD